MNSNNTNNNRSLTSDATTDTSFVSWLRRSGRLLAHYDDQEKGNLLIKHQNKFPQKIQEEIRRLIASGVMPGIVYRGATWAIRKLLFCTTNPGTVWAGLDSEVDTEEQVELAVRISPDVLFVTTGSHPVYCATTCRKSLSFAPMLAELAIELNDDDHVASVSPLFPFIHLFSFRPPPHDDDYEQELDLVTLSALMRLRNKRNFWELGGLIRFIIHKSFELNHIRTEKTLRFVIDWHPFLLKQNRHWSHGPLIQKTFYSTLSAIEKLKRFRMLFELGMIRYPESMGFLFAEAHVTKTTFEVASSIFGKEATNEMVEQVLIKVTEGQFEKIHALIVAVAASGDSSSLDGLYLLCRLHAAVLMRSY